MRVGERLHVAPGLVPQKQGTITKARKEPTIRVVDGKRLALDRYYNGYSNIEYARAYPPILLSSFYICTSIGTVASLLSLSPHPFHLYHPSARSLRANFIDTAI